MTIEELKALDSAATTGPWPPVMEATPAELPFGYIQLPWTTVPLEDYALCAKLRNLAPEILALVEAANASREGAGWEINDALNAFNAKLASL